MGINVKMRRSLAGCIAGAGFFVLAAGSAGTASAAQCLSDAAGQPDLRCTANDLGVSSVVINNLLDGCDFVGDSFTFNGKFGVASASPTRYDLGFYVGADGTQSYNGNCSVSIVPTSGGFPNLDGDMCGDYDGSAMLVPVTDVTSKCVDTDQNGFYDLSICTSWDNNTMPNCSGPADAVPATRSKCNCAIVNTTMQAPHCATNSECVSDNNPCTNEICNALGSGRGDSFGCSHDNNTASCDDGQFCTVNDQCSAGSCSGAARSCGDGNVCTTDSCNEATDACVNANNTVSCNDGLFCTTGDTCSAGSCVGAPRTCNDSNGCTDDSCNESIDVCVNSPNTATCDDGQFCTVGDICSAGACVASPRDCGDGNLCTTDSCNESTDACVNASNGIACDDGLFCTTGDTCSAGVCVGTPRTCNDSNACTNDSCSEEADVCVNGPNTNPCDDGQFCTTGDVCSGGVCTATPRACGDGNVCTDDSCDDEVNACVNANNAVGCDDGLFCTTGDTCSTGSCSGTLRACDDANVCTNDSCDDEADACTNVPNVGPCDDGLFCTTGDICSGGVCATAPRDCGDADVCTDDSCDDELNVCVNANNASPCDDGLFCTVGDTCSEGACTATPRSCDDSNLCTDDSCDEPGASCTNTANEVECDDGLYCNGFDQCGGDSCNHGGNPCDGTDGDADCSESCDEIANGCGAADPNGTICDDGLFCNGGPDTCLAGECATHPGFPCTDGIFCTQDACDEEVDACVNPPVPNGTVCEDDDICTIEGECTNGACISIPTVLGDLCPWIIVGRAGPRRDTLKIRTRDLIGGDICGGTVKVGNGTSIMGDAASGRSSGDVMRLSPDTFVSEDIVTMGGSTKATPGSGKLPHLLLPTSKLPPGSVTAKLAPVGFYDMTGATLLATDCLTARTDAYTAAVSLLDALLPTETLGTIRLKKGQSSLITATNPGGVNVVDIAYVKTGRSAIIELNGGNNPNSSIVLRIVKKFQLGLGTKVVLSGGLTPESVLIYVQGKKCAIGNLGSGAGTLFCANGRMKTGRGVQWTGTFYGAGNLSRFGNTNELVYSPFLGF